MANMDLEGYLRSLIVGADAKVPYITGEYVSAINFDNAATTPPFCAVMRAVNDFAPWYSSIHRGKGYKSTYSSSLYEEGREIIKKFVNNTNHEDIVIYTKNTTEAINILSYALRQVGQDQVILSTDMEHLANDLPWRVKFPTDYVALDAHGKLSLDDLEAKLIKYTGKVKLVAVTGASNVTGYINPIHDIARLAHQYGAKILVDAAQLAPHAAIDVKHALSAEHIDYLVFSAHKMYAPFGLGVLIGPKETFAGTVPVYQGGGAVRLVARQFIQWDDPPDSYEAGTPNLMGVVALIAAIKTVNSVGLNNIHRYETDLLKHAVEALKDIPSLKLYAQYLPHEEPISLIPFNLEGFHHRLLAEILSREAGIATRSGLFCAHPYAAKLLGLTDDELEYFRQTRDVPLPGMVRISFGLYNNKREIELLANMLNQIVRNREYYKVKYKNVLLAHHKP